jgi:DNA-binding response OmpR family regulator
MVGADVDALISARQALARQGMSVSMAWNAKQADDLLGMVRPQIVVVDLDLPGRDGYGIVAHLAGMPTVPMALVIVGADDPAPRLASLVADPALAERHLPRDRYLRVVLDEKQAAPPKKRNVRALR